MHWKNSEYLRLDFTQSHTNSSIHIKNIII